MNDAILEIKEVSKFYHNHTALKKVSLQVPRGSIFGLLGPNGAGKTSLIRMITQITLPDEGEIIFEGERIRPKHIRSIGYLPEERGLYKNMKVGEQLLYLGRLKGLDNQTLKQSLKFWLERLEMLDWWEKRISELSKGMQQKVQFIATVIHQPHFIILDEPFTGFDPVNTELIRQEIIRLKNEGATILFSTHRMESVEEICDHIGLINNAQIVLEGKTKAVREQFRQNQWIVEGRGPLEEMDLKGLQILKKHQEDQHFRLLLQLEEGQHFKDLLPHFEGLEIRSMQESVPSVHDIFIRMVKGQLSDELEEAV